MAATSSGTPKMPFEAQVVLADDPRHPVAAMVDHAPAARRRSRRRPGRRPRRRGGSSRRAAGRLEHEQDRRDAEEDVEVVGLRGAAHELVEGDERVAERDHRAGASSQSVTPGLAAWRARRARPSRGRRGRSARARRRAGSSCGTPARPRTEHPVDRVERQPAQATSDDLLVDRVEPARRASGPRTPRRAPADIRGRYGHLVLHLDGQVPRAIGVQRVALAADLERAPPGGGGDQRQAVEAARGRGVSAIQRPARLGASDRVVVEHGAAGDSTPTMRKPSATASKRPRAGTR